VSRPPAARPSPKAEHASGPRALPAGRGYTVALRTSCGDIEIRLATARAPKTASSFASLVRQGFYDGLAFHRVVRGFVIQGGDPKGTGLGGPGYQITEKPPSGLRYTRGTVAMAKTEADPPGVSGSQFFVVTAPDAGLPPDYALVGRVSAGMDVVDRIDALRTDASDRPQPPVVIEKATLQAR
jgi:cyclophilin family peptidyl-prolyl cis-trans isomerase